jgi:pumilio RNA-binding family
MDANISASSKGLGSSASNNYGSILGSPLSKNGSPDREISMRVPSPGIPPIGVKLNSINRRMTTNGSSIFSNASSGMDRTDEMVSAFSALSVQQGTDAFRSSINQQADPNNIIHSYLELDRNYTAHSTVSRNYTHLPESTTYSGLNDGPCMFERTGNGGYTSPDISRRFQCYLEYFKRIQDAYPTMKLSGQQQMVQQHYAYSGDHGVLPGFMVDSAFPLLPASDQIRPGDCGLMRCPSGLRKFSNFSNHIPTLLEEFKSNKTKCYELSEIAGYVVEFRCV